MSGTSRDPKDAANVALKRDSLHVLAGTLRDFRRFAEVLRDRMARSLGMTPMDLTCLGYLYAKGASSPRDIIPYLGLTSGAATALFDRLEQDGYVRRMPNPKDRRSILIELCHDKAQPVVERYMSIEERFLKCVEDYSEDEIRFIISFLDRMRDAAKEQESELQS